MHIRKNMIAGNKGFTCKKCRKKVPPHPNSSRNHCPHCLFSLHVDLDVPGDRQNPCKGLMAPVGLDLHKKKGPRVEHLCQKCGHTSFNRCAPEDNWDIICQLSRIPRSQ